MDSKFKNILVIVIGFVLISFVIDSKWLLYFATAIGTLSLLSNSITNIILKIWFGIAKVLGYVNSRILLSFIFYVFLFPLALIAKLTGSLSFNTKKSDTTYFEDRNHLYDKSDLEKPW